MCSRCFPMSRQKESERFDKITTVKISRQQASNRDSERRNPENIFPKTPDEQRCFYCNNSQACGEQECIWHEGEDESFKQEKWR